ncbi:sulfite exporter TauE/SafE family protein [uncultured Arcticibacterium sp.]|uniref:sulfite exporter TauE/SafE family protein n=1 Tax=uncultured Arcticibacterium sp. TaxID=2173042 RepID=UPI0030FBBB10
MNIADLLFYFLTLLAEILGTIGGFGSSVFFVPMAGFFYDFQAVLGLTALYHVFSNLSKIVLFFKGMDRRIFLIIGIPSIIFVVLGAYLSQFLKGDIPALILGLFLVAFSLFLLLKPDFTLKRSNQNGILGGSLSGLAAGVLGTGGAIRGLTLASFNVEKATFLATSALIDFGVDSSRFVVYYSQDYITKDMLWKAPVLLIISFLGTWLGKKMLNKISQENFRKIALWLILIVGITSVVKFLL